ncbi:hypothetical protein [Sphaerisporangium sp. TRM90804]|uniref:hypothetical protein n=1 Tax=Sphaerisporangium sp. TRM90804 TaxID=3031113 RepID=UPI00244704DC|nr:hypothetical protein [Sphaerisporangium sp. TRM90804]MDH2425747.1 hypothetical protein [Sphaerisporangium sp. TRM90804]
MITSPDRRLRLYAVRATAVLVPVAALMLLLVPGLTGVLRTLGVLAALLVVFHALARTESPPPRPGREDYRRAFLHAFADLRDDPDDFASRLADVAYGAQPAPHEDLIRTQTIRPVPGDQW